MPHALVTGPAANVGIFLKSLRSNPIETSIESLIALFKRRQIKSSRPCAIATAHLLLQVIAKMKWSNVGRLLERVQEVGQRLMEAQPREMVVGNIVRRVLGMIRDEAKEDRTEETGANSSATNSQVGSPTTQHRDLPSREHAAIQMALSSLRNGTATSDLSGEEESDDVFTNAKSVPSRPPMVGSSTSYAVLTGTNSQKSQMFNLLTPAEGSPAATPPVGNMSPKGKSDLNIKSLSMMMNSTTNNIKSEVITGVEEIIDELEQVDDQIASYALDHIHSNEVILTHTSSRSVQKFLLRAASKRKFTVILVESYPNNHSATHAIVAGSKPRDNESEHLSHEVFMKPLSATGITVILIPDSAVFAIMSRVNKVILATHAVIANGGLVAAAGARVIARAASVHKVPVTVVSGVFKLSPDYPFEFESLIEYGEPNKIVPYDQGELVEGLEIDNPVYDYVPPDLVDLYITNL
ncbi:translation initiation factor-like protein eIF-2B subunit beta [Calycina marina]|uniref:Translation initiation factor eIF2B subunit beta n=1 Tax=Calycina marina TaxID=1763456 RepID=A0A9P8CI61_9HELO|nr:translation initiation factor-like protein eIF-2B subunit beta [Calycina marina]